MIKQFYLIHRMDQGLMAMKRYFTFFKTPVDGLVLYTEHFLGKSLLSVEMQSVHSSAADWPGLKKKKKKMIDI